MARAVVRERRRQRDAIAQRAAAELQRAEQPWEGILDANHCNLGGMAPSRSTRTTVALVDEARCIGCTRCIAACPVDAIVGAQGLMHTVVETWCIGCALCLPPCPVDCIDMVAPRGRWTETLR